ncbi:MAG: regulatory protein RecX [Anaerovoracaceae bacterium]
MTVDERTAGPERNTSERAAGSERNTSERAAGSERSSAEKCRSAALRYVSMAAKTEGQVKDYLVRKEFSETEIEEAIEMLREYRYVDDERYCRDYYIQGCRKGRGRRRIEQELERKKISRSIIRESLDNFLSEENPDYQDILEETLTEKERAMALGRKMLKEQLSLGKSVDKAFCAKVARRLTSMGYDGSSIYSVIGYIMKNSQNGDF